MSRRIYPDDSEENVVAATLFEEAWGEKDPRSYPAVAHVIDNRAQANKPHWGGSSRKDVCTQKSQFECWNKGYIEITNEKHFERAKRATKDMMEGRSRDPTNGCDHYNNPAKENPDWVRGVHHVMDIENHAFYKEK